MFIIEDSSHAEPLNIEFKSYESAFIKLKELSNIPWNQKPNKCPCSNWENCERSYEIIEYDNSSIPWKEINRTSILNISKGNVSWLI